MEKLSVVDGKFQGLTKNGELLHTLKKYKNHLSRQLHQPVHVRLESSKVVTHVDQVQVMDDHQVACYYFLSSPDF